MGKGEKIILLIACFAVTVGIASVLAFREYRKNEAIKAQKAEEAKEARNSYIGLLQDSAETMNTGAREAADLCSLAGKVWYNAIYEQQDGETNAFTRNPSGEYHNYKESLSLLYADSDTLTKTNLLRENQKALAEKMKSLQNPAAEFQQSYQAVSELYGTYQQLTALALSPEGSLNTYISNADAKTKAFTTQYETLKSLIPPKEAT